MKKLFSSPYTFCLAALVAYIVAGIYWNDLSWYYVAVFIIVIVVFLAIAAYKFFMWLIEQWSK